MMTKLEERNRVGISIGLFICFSAIHVSTLRVFQLLNFVHIRLFVCLNNCLHQFLFFFTVCNFGYNSAIFANKE